MKHWISRYLLGVVTPLLAVAAFVGCVKYRSAPDRLERCQHRIEILATDQRSTWTNCNGYHKITVTPNLVLGRVVVVCECPTPFYPDAPFETPYKAP